MKRKSIAFIAAIMAVTTVFAAGCGTDNEANSSNESVSDVKLDITAADAVEKSYDAIQSAKSVHASVTVNGSVNVTFGTNDESAAESESKDIDMSMTGDVTETGTYMNYTVKFDGEDSSYEQYQVAYTGDEDYKSTVYSNESGDWYSYDSSDDVNELFSSIPSDKDTIDFSVFETGTVAEKDGNYVISVSVQDILNNSAIKSAIDDAQESESGISDGFDNMDNGLFSLFGNTLGNAESFNGIIEYVVDKNYMPVSLSISGLSGTVVDTVMDDESYRVDIDFDVVLSFTGWNETENVVVPDDVKTQAESNIGGLINDFDLY